MDIYNYHSPLSSAAMLRDRAEERMGARTPEMFLPQDREATQRIVHELEVHQIELVMQNEELREARYEVETALEKYTDLYELAPVGYFSLDHSGNISAANLASANLLRIERSLLIGRSFEQFISEEYRTSFSAFLATAFTSRNDEACVIVIIDNVNTPVCVQIGASISASGEECHLALIDITGQRAAEHLG